jgi:hypothetical protein
LKLLEATGLYRNQVFKLGAAPFSFSWLSSHLMLGRKRIKVLSSDIINSINCSLFGDVDIENRISYSANGS